jgi:RNA-directed DNA polymerase
VGSGTGHHVAESFDRINHDWLLKHIPMDKELLRRWLQAGFLEKHALFATTEGTPQGGIIAPPTIWQTPV